MSPRVPLLHSAQMRKISKTSYFVFLLFLVIVEVHGRYLLPDHASELVSDGVHSVQPNKTSYLRLKGLDSSYEEHCEQMYGFLPCTNNIFGHLFLILVYEYLLFHGESYLASGGEQIFKILGPGIFGASAFHILGALPESLILLGMLYISFPYLKLSVLKVDLCSTCLDPHVVSSYVFCRCMFSWT